MTKAGMEQINKLFYQCYGKIVAKDVNTSTDDYIMSLKLYLFLQPESQRVRGKKVTH